MTGGAAPNHSMVPRPSMRTKLLSTASLSGAISMVRAHASATAGASPCAQRHCRIGNCSSRSWRCLNRYGEFAVLFLLHRKVARTRPELDEGNGARPCLVNDDPGALASDDGDFLAMAGEQGVVEIAIAGDLKRQVCWRELLRHGDADDGASRAIGALRQRLASR